MKLGAIFALLPFYIVNALAPGQPNAALVWVFGITGFILAGVSMWLLRDRGEEFNDC